MFLCAGTYVPSTMDFPQSNGDKSTVPGSFGFHNPYELQGNVICPGPGAGASISACLLVCINLLICIFVRTV